MSEFHQLMGAETADTADPEEDDFVRLLNVSFTGDPLSAADAMALHGTVAFSDFAPTPFSPTIILTATSPGST